jgi:hypothetical protein
MGGGMTQDFQTFFILSGKKPQIRILFDHEGSIDDVSINPARQRGFCETRPNISGDLMDAYRLSVLTVAAVR